MRKFIVIGLLLLPYSLIMNGITFYHSGYGVESKVDSRVDYNSIYYYCFDYIDKNIDSLSNVYKSTDCVSIEFEEYKIWIFDTSFRITIDDIEVMRISNEYNYKLMLRVMERYE